MVIQEGLPWQIDYRTQVGPTKKPCVLQPNLEDLVLAFSSSSEVRGGDSGPEIETHAFCIMALMLRSV